MRALHRILAGMAVLAVGVSAAVAVAQPRVTAHGGAASR
jgi:hypothetical protein